MISEQQEGTTETAILNADALSLQNDPIATLRRLHAQLGHPSADAMKTLQLASGTIISGIQLHKKQDKKIHMIDCDACKTAKQTRPIIGMVPDLYLPTRPNQYLAFDILTLETVAVNGCEYLLVGVDEYTGYMWTHPIRNKSGATKWVLHIFNEIKTRFPPHLQVQRLRTDRGETYNNVIIQYCFDNNIDHRPTQGYASEQNPHAERYIRTASEMTRAILHHAFAPKELWPYASDQATFIWNNARINKTFNKTRSQLFRDKSDIVPLEHLKVMFCDAWARNPKAHKLDPRCKPVIHLGYNETESMYILYDNESRTEFHSRHVLFNETSFIQLNVYSAYYEYKPTTCGNFNLFAEIETPTSVEPTSTSADQYTTMDSVNTAAINSIRSASFNPQVASIPATSTPSQMEVDIDTNIATIDSESQSIHSLPDHDVSGLLEAIQFHIMLTITEQDEIVKQLIANQAPKLEIDKEKRILSRMYCDTNNYEPDDLFLPSMKKNQIKMPSQRCVAATKQQLQCGRSTLNGKHCYTHLKLIDGLTIKSKGSVDTKGKGLFAARAFKKDEVVAFYTGDIYKPSESSNHSDYVLEIKRDQLLDAARTNSSPGRLLNDARNSPLQNNCKFSINHRSKEITIKATRDIKAGEELLLSYGSGYWSKHKAALPPGTGIKSNLPSGQPLKQRPRAIRLPPPIKEIHALIAHAIVIADRSVKTAMLRNPLPTEYDNLPQLKIAAKFVIAPKHFKDIATNQHASYWYKAWYDEINSLRANSVYELVDDIPPGHTALPLLAVFKTKSTAEGVIDKCKVRITAQGQHQEYSINYKDTYAPTLSLKSLKILIAITALLDLEMDHLDVITAFLNGTLDEEVYCRPLAGMDGYKEHKFLKLLRSLYGLKQASRQWHAKLNEILALAGFKPLNNIDDCVYTKISKTGRLLIIAAFVDDLFKFYHLIDKAEMQGCIDLMGTKFKLKDLGPAAHILGIKITRNRRNKTILLNQESHINSMLESYGMLDCNENEIPGTANLGKSTLALEDNQSEEAAAQPSKKSSMKNQTTRSMFTIDNYRAIVGSLQYVATATRPDIAHATSELGRYNNQPHQIHLEAAKKIFRYLKGTTTLGLTYSAKPLCTDGKVESSTTNNNIPILKGFCDSDWAGDPQSSKSTSGEAMKIANCVVTWKSKRQTIIAVSSSEAEYIAASNAGKEIIWIRHLLAAINLEQTKPTRLLIDNNNCILMINNNSGNFEQRKHIRLRYHWIQQEINLKTIEPEAVNTLDNESDIFTKQLDKNLFIPIRNRLMNISPESLEELKNNKRH
jgi:hypothetical protein